MSTSQSSLGAGITSAIQAQQTKTAMGQLQANVAKTQSDISLQDKQKDLLFQQTQAAMYNSHSAKAKAEIDTQQAKLYKDNPSLMTLEKYSELLGNALNGVGSAASIYNMTKPIKLPEQHEAHDREVYETQYDKKGNVKSSTKRVETGTKAAGKYFKK